MKNYSILFLLISLFTFFSCSKIDLNEKSKKSNDELGLRTSNNYENISLEDLEILPLQNQRAIFIEITPAKRLQLWTDRMNKAKLSLNSNQIANLVTIENLLNINLFSDTLSNSNELFITNWVNQMVIDSVWNKKDIYYLLCTFTKVGDYVSALIPGGPDYSAPDCNCNGDFYCMFLGHEEYCDFKKGTCDKTRSGCGWLFTKPCRGRCALYMGPEGN
ncbi:MAG: bacteriocin fulvocin C-related protein [Deltaproteobacteria bacterium]